MATFLAAGTWAGSAEGATVAADALGELGDEHIVYPAFASADYQPPVATVAPAGDVNGDGIDDSAIIVDSDLTPRDPAFTPTLWINFSQPRLPTTLYAGEPGWHGIKVTSAGFAPQLAGVGDVNGDGLADVAVATEDSIYVIFGRPDDATVDLGDLGNNGFRIGNARPVHTGGTGTIYGGSVRMPYGILGAGDQNGDGSPDVAFFDGDAVKVVYSPPTPAGQTVDADNLGLGGYTLETNASVPGFALGTLGDLNGDGRQDLAVIWNESSGVRAVGVYAPEPGAHVTLGDVAQNGEGFEFYRAGATTDGAMTISDQNGDGSRDLVVVSSDGTAYRVESIAFTPPAGTRRALGTLSAADGVERYTGSGQIFDAGDQDEDGRADIAGGNEIEFSSAPDDWQAGLFPGAFFYGVGGMLSASLPDRNADGKRELVTAQASPFADNPGDHRATWTLNVFLSAKRPTAESSDVPVQNDGTVAFSGGFRTGASPGTRSLAVRARVQLIDVQTGRRQIVNAPETLDGGAGSVEAAVTAGPTLVAGHDYQYRLGLENGRGLTGVGDLGAFHYLGPPLPPISTPPAPAARQLTGTARADRIFGTPFDDVLRGLAGNDLLRGRGGNDRLYGGRGNDRLYGDAGDDRLNGGAGRDRLDGGAGDDALFGGAGNDRLLGGAGKDFIQGGPGADRITGGRGTDHIEGGAGDDVIDAADGRRETVRCGRGRDRAVADRADRLIACERTSRRRR